MSAAFEYRNEYGRSTTPKEWTALQCVRKQLTRCFLLTSIYFLHPCDANAKFFGWNNCRSQENFDSKIPDFAFSVHFAVIRSVHSPRGSIVNQSHEFYAQIIHKSIRPRNDFALDEILTMCFSVSMGKLCMQFCDCVSECKGIRIQTNQITEKQETRVR